MEQPRSRDDAGKQARQIFYSHVRIEITDRAVGKNQPDIKPDQRPAPAKNKTHESADGAVFLDAVPVVNPNDREVLHVVKNFEERDAGENIGDAVVAIPPERDAGKKERDLHRILSTTRDPHPNKVG